MLQTHKELTSHVIKMKEDEPQAALNAAQQNPAQEFENSVDLVFEKSRTVFLTESASGRSEQFMEVRKVLDLALTDPDFISRMKEGRVFAGDESYGKYLKLYEALSTYIAGHRGAHSKEGKARYDVAESLREIIDLAAFKHLESVGALPHTEPPAPASEEEISFAKKSLSGLAKYYRSYSQRVAEDMIATSEEKLYAKWNVLKASERDIIILNENSGVYADIPEEAAFLMREYESIKAQILLLDKAKEKGDAALLSNTRSKALRDHLGGVIGREPGREGTLLNDDDGLSPKQLNGLSRLDNWVMRNLRNGGYMTLGLNTTDRSDFATKLMSMPKRQRLYVYYLVESRERVEPTQDGFARAQVGYVPDLAIFKRHMIASKAKFYTRFSGGYVYWRKLAEAVGIAERKANAFGILKEIREDEKNGVDRQAYRQTQGLNENQKKRQKFKALLSNLLESVRLDEELKASKTDSEKENIKQRLSDLKGEQLEMFELMVGDLEELQQMAAEDQRKDVMTDAINDYGGDFSGDISTSVGAIKNAAVGIGELSGKLLKSMDSILGTGEQGSGALSSVASIVFDILTLMDKGEGMSGADKAGFISDMVSQTAMISNNAGEIMMLFSPNSVAEVLTTPVAGIGISATALLVCGVKSASHMRNGHYRKKASELAKNQQGEDKYRDGMVRLNRKLGGKQKANNATNWTNAAVATGITALTSLSIVSGGVAAIIAGAGLGVSIACRFIENKYSGKMRRELVENYFEVDKVLDDAVLDWENEHGRRMNPKQKAIMRSQLSRRMAAQAGFASPQNAAKQVASEYARYLLDGAKENTDKGKMCRSMIRGLGLKYKQDTTNPDNSVPTDGDIIEKLCG